MSTQPTKQEVDAARNDPKLANTLYHDWEASSYDEKWSISYDERCITYAKGRFDLIAGDAEQPYASALELGCGTGFFMLNLMQAGVIERGFVTDISPGMVEVAVRNAASLGLAVEGRVADAESIPYDDDTFDLVVGHAVLHHIPEVEIALKEVLRVLKPGGRFVFAGEPTKHGDFIARRLSRLTWAAAMQATRIPGLKEWAKPQTDLDASSEAAALEAVVDLHTFRPSDLEAIASAAGALDVVVKTEELTASWLGWPIRTLECALRPERISDRFRWFSYKAWVRLSALDAAVMTRIVPKGLFYNALVTGTKGQ